MPFCGTCGLSMSETAGFCPTCGTRAAGGTSASAVARPAWAGPEASAPDEWLAPVQLVTAPKAKPRSALDNDLARLAIAGAVAALVIVIAALCVHLIVSGIRSERYSVAKYEQITPGLSLTQVETALGGPPTSQRVLEDGTIAAYWTNSDGSLICVGTDNGVVSWKVAVGPHGKGRLGDSGSIALGAWGLVAVMTVFTAVVSGACLFFCARLFGRYITVSEVVVFCVVTGVLRLIPVVGGLFALLVGVALVQRSSSTGWWTALLIILVAGFATGVVAIAVLGAGAGLGSVL